MLQRTVLPTADAAVRLSPLVASRPRVTVWDRLAVALIGLAGFALSFDALQQMAVAIHVRGPLTYVFPFTLDGFIAYGVRALLVLRAAPWTARAYAWLLFAGATGASVWANALHAVRLNHVLDGAGQLRLGDTAVGVLATLSPIALGGAVHLYILIARHIPEQPATDGGPSGWTSADPVPSAAHEPDGTATAGPVPGPHDADDHPSAGDGDGQGTGSAELPDAEEPEDDHPADEGEEVRTRRTGRPPGASMDQLLKVSRPAVRAHGRPSRPVVERAVREANLPLGSTRFTVLMDELRKEFPEDQARPHPRVD
ncbi:DUF2637 domain-containing protein [Kitasatospora sp. NPDC101176]|uniref:DUF2637 domain-containing protein n=1 Tax=Kitasatospora sp. NPDC101176 TaxID=3364099 RepID=UPI0037FF3B8E